MLINSVIKQTKNLLSRYGYNKDFFIYLITGPKEFNLYLDGKKVANFLVDKFSKKDILSQSQNLKEYLIEQLTPFFESMPAEAPKCFDDCDVVDVNSTIVSPLGTNGGILLSDDTILDVNLTNNTVGVTGSVNIDNTVGVTGSVNIDNTVGVTGTIDSNSTIKSPLGIYGGVKTSVTEEIQDAFARLRVSNPVTLFESSMEVDNQPLLWDDLTTGSGSNTYNNTESSVTLSTGGANSSALRQSHQYIHYQPGKSMLTLISTNIGAKATGTTKRVGLFDIDNGIFLEQTENDLRWVRRSFVTGVAVDYPIEQSDWNIDTLDGNGFSGYIFDESNTNLIVIDLEWLGVGRVRCGFFIEGTLIYTHQFSLSLPTVYMQRASLPIRYEISSDGTAVSNEDLIQICSTAISEGGFEPRGMIRTIDNSITERIVGNGSYLPIIAIRLKSSFSKAILTPLNLQVATTSNNLVNYRLLIRTTITGGTWNSASEAAEYNVSGTSFSGGIEVDAGYLTNRASTSTSDLENTTLTNGSDINGVIDEITIVAISFTGNTDVVAALKWRELY